MNRRPVLWRAALLALVTGLVATSVVALVSSGPASAQRVTLRDPGNDSALGAGVYDIGRLVVQHRPRVLRAEIRLVDREHPDQYELHIDTTPRRHGPDFVVLDYRGAWGSQTSLFRARGWRSRDVGRAVSCSGLKVHRSRHARARDRARIEVPRSCLGNPRRVRVQAVSAQEHRVNDYAPGAYRPTRWLRAG